VTPSWAATQVWLSIAIINWLRVGVTVARSNPTRVTLDAENNRALVINKGLDALITVDLATGNRTTLADAATGTGPAFSNPGGGAPGRRQ
jgi:hypothetical protein